jgi:hypothetical protein
VAALDFLAISLAVFHVFGLIYRRMMRHMPGAAAMKYQRMLR